MNTIATSETPSSNGSTNGSAPRTKKRGVPDGLWLRCPGCTAMVYRKQMEQQLNVCPYCEYHFYVPALDRIRQVLDEGTFEEWDASEAGT